jgi:hypothetical protein
VDRSCQKIPTGSITPYGVEQKANNIVTKVKIIITFCVAQNVIQIYYLVRKFNVLTDFCEKFSLFAYC